MKKHRFNTKDLKSGTPKGPAIKPPLPNPKRRPNHKAALRRAAWEAEIAKAYPEPMTLLHKREKELLDLRGWKPPVTLGAVDKAATAMAEWDNADPFAYNRTALHVKQGYLNSNEVVEEMQKRTIARRAARAMEVERAKAAS